MAFRAIGDRVDNPIWAREWLSAYVRYPDHVPRPGDKALIALGGAFVRLDDTVASGTPVGEALARLEHELGLRATGKGKASPLDVHHASTLMTLRLGAVLITMEEDGVDEGTAILHVELTYPELGGESALRRAMHLHKETASYTKPSAKKSADASTSFCKKLFRQYRADRPVDADP